eukprot:11674988-Heterocapsa_arctica.AAC.1
MRASLAVSPVRPLTRAAFRPPGFHRGPHQRSHYTRVTSHPCASPGLHPSPAVQPPYRPAPWPPLCGAH